jgi:hypothetical protein
LSGLLTLEDLELDGTNVTDAGLASLSPLTQLTSLTISKTTVTSSGVDDLHRVLPNCTIVR